MAVAELAFGLVWLAAGTTSAGYPAGVVLVVVIAGSVALIGQAPGVALLISLAANTVYGALGYPGSPVGYAPYLALGALAAVGSWWRLGGLGLAGASVALIGLFRPSRPGLAEISANLAVVLVFYAAGSEVQHWRDRHRRTLERLRASERLAGIASRQQRNAERLELAGELHDTLGHALAVVGTQARIAQRALPTDPVRARAACETIERRAREALEEVQGLVGELDSERNDTYGVREELSVLAETARSGGLEVVITDHGPPLPLAPVVATTLARAAREALTNTLRHSDATNVEIRLVWDQAGATLQAVISDDGRGGPLRPGTGLNSMRKRVAFVGGTLTITSPPTTGVTIELLLPLSATPTIPAGAHHPSPETAVEPTGLT